MARANEVFTRARRGQHVETGEACGLPLSNVDARERWQDALGANGALRASVHCDAKSTECTLQVHAFDALGWDGAQVLERVAPFERDRSWREALQGALASLEPRPEGDKGSSAGALAALLGDSGTVEVKPEELGFWVAPEQTDEAVSEAVLKEGLTLAQGLAPLRRRFERDSKFDSLLIEIDERGRVARCEPIDDYDAVGRCGCEVFTQHATVRPELRGRRLIVGLTFRAADVVTSSGDLLSAHVRTRLKLHTSPDGSRRFLPSVSDPSVSDWRPPDEAVLERCFLDAALGERSGLVTVRFDAVGNAVGVDVAPHKGELSDAQRACVARAFKASRAPCPAVEGATARAVVVVRARRVGEKIPSLFDVE